MFKNNWLSKVLNFLVTKKINNKSYTKQQKEYLLDLLFEGSIFIDLYCNDINPLVHIEHTDKDFSSYIQDLNHFPLHRTKILDKFSKKFKCTNNESIQITTLILRDITKIKDITTGEANGLIYYY